MSFQRAESGGQMSAVDYDQGGTRRESRPITGGAGAGGAQSPQVTVNVQAMDARVFWTQQRHCGGGAGSDVKHELDQRCGE